MSSIDRLSGLEASTALKAPALVASTTNVALSGLQTIDGVSVVSGSRVLLTSQADASENGIWVASENAWSRATDFNGIRDIVKGTQIFVTDGSTLANSYYVVTSASPVIGGGDLTIERLTSAASNPGADQTSFTATDRINSTDVQSAVVEVDAKIGNPSAAGTAFLEAADLAAQKTILDYGEAADLDVSTNADWSVDSDQLSNRLITKAMVDVEIAASQNLAAAVRFNGQGVPAIETSVNVASITDLGVGNFQVNFAEDLATANPIVNILFNASGGSVSSVNVFDVSTTVSDVTFSTVFNGALFDPDQVHVLVFEE